MNYAAELAAPNIQTTGYPDSRIHKCDFNSQLGRTNTTVLCPATDLKSAVKCITKINAYSYQYVR